MNSAAISVANYIVNKLHHVSKIKLNYLLYYSQAWYMVNHGEMLFFNPITLNKNYQYPYVGDFGPIDSFSVDWEFFRNRKVNLNKKQKKQIKKVIKYYGKFNLQQLADTFRKEKPFILDEYGDINLLKMKEYYGKL